MTLTIYRTTDTTVTWDVDGCAPSTCTAAYLASRKAHLVRTGGDEQGRVNVAVPLVALIAAMSWRWEA